VSRTRALAVAGMGSTAVAAVLIGLLHLLPPSADLNPVRRTISEYALLETGWVFDLAVLTLVAGSTATLAALLGARLMPAASTSALALLLWSVGLTAVIFFPKHNWSLGPSMHGQVHRLASVVAFVSLPVAALLLARGWHAHPQWRMPARWSLALGLLSLLAFAPIPVAVALEPFTGVRWWRAIPLGAVERLLAVAEVATILVLGWWAARAADTRGAGSARPTAGSAHRGR
jgi:hypothetical protein